MGEKDLHMMEACKAIIGALELLIEHMPVDGYGRKAGIQKGLADASTFIDGEIADLEARRAGYDAD